MRPHLRKSGLAFRGRCNGPPRRSRSWNAYWPGRIKAERVSDGLMDLFNTSLALGGIIDKIPSERYIDGIDQTSFLLADDGQSNRQAVFSHNQADFSGLRWGEFKAYFKVMPCEQPFSNISMSTFVPVGVSPWVFDIYRDPKERLTRSNGDYEWVYGPILQMQTAHAATFVKPEVNAGKWTPPSVVKVD